MPASISSVTLMGYGNGTFVGSVNLLPTIGYGIGAASAPVAPTEGFVAGIRDRVLLASAYRDRVLIAKDGRP